LPDLSSVRLARYSANAIPRNAAVLVDVDKARPGEPEWMQGFGKLRRLRKETARIQARIHEAFEVIEPEDRA